jgi:hypothetical protein
MSGHASSPHSSNEVASHHGTPETRLTAFSPEDTRGDRVAYHHFKFEDSDDEHTGNGRLATRVT